MTGEPVAWLVIDEGWEVVGRDTQTVGRVKEVRGDSNADIFDGLVLTRGLLRKDLYLPSERVAAIYEGRVEIDLDEAEVEALAGPDGDAG